MRIIVDSMHDLHKVPKMGDGAFLSFNLLIFICHYNPAFMLNCLYVVISICEGKLTLSLNLYIFTVKPTWHNDP